MSNIIEIPNVRFDANNKIYYENDTQLINLDNISTVEPRYYAVDPNKIAKYDIYFSKDVYTYTSENGYKLIKEYISKKEKNINNYEKI